MIHLPPKVSHPASGRSPDSRFIELAAFPIPQSGISGFLGQPSTITVAGPSRIRTGFPIKFSKSTPEVTTQLFYSSEASKSSASVNSLFSLGLALRVRHGKLP
jgi:hypothetical protein